VEWTGGGLVSSSADLARWAQVLFEGDAMAGDYLTELLAGPTVDTSGPLRYGLGVTIQEGGALGTTLGHGGWIPGYCTSLRYYPEYGVAIAFQINTDVGVMDGAPSHIDLIEERLARVVMSDEANAGGGV
jgi:D-alanyl-D-alanine carboxypeptidase